MGVIISESHSILKPDHKIQIQNFRGIKQLENDQLIFNPHINDIRIVSGLLVIINLSEEYFFDSMTINDFFRIKNSKKNTKWQAKYIREVLVCSYCGGSGKTDWVSNIIQHPLKFDMNHRISFRRIKDSYSLCQSTKYYLSKACLKDKHEIHCSKCGGTGMRFINPDNLKPIKFEGDEYV